MKDFTVEERKFRNLNVIINKENSEDYVSDKSFDDETVPDEEFNKNKKIRSKLPSCPSVEQKGPNINLKIHQKRYSNQKEKEFFLLKLKGRKRLNYAKIMSFITIVIIKMNVVLLMEWMN